MASFCKSRLGYERVSVGIDIFVFSYQFSFEPPFPFPPHFPLSFPSCLPLSVPGVSIGSHLVPPPLSPPPPPLLQPFFHHLLLLLLAPPLSSRTGRRRQPCLVLDEWELRLCAFVEKRMWWGVCAWDFFLLWQLCVVCILHASECASVWDSEAAEVKTGIIVKMSWGQHSWAVFISACSPSLFSFSSPPFLPPSLHMFA